MCIYWFCVVTDNTGTAIRQLLLVYDSNCTVLIKSLLVTIPYVTTTPLPLLISLPTLSFLYTITSPANKGHILLSAPCQTNSMVDRDYDLFCLLLFPSLPQEPVAQTRDFICWIMSPACTTYQLCHLRKVTDL